MAIYVQLMNKVYFLSKNFFLMCIILFDMPEAPDNCLTSEYDSFVRVLTRLPTSVHPVLVCFFKIYLAKNPSLQVLQHILEYILQTHF